MKYRVGTVLMALCFCCHVSALLDVQPLVDRLSVEEKVGQLLMVSFCGTTANHMAEQLISDLHVGGFIYYNWANDLTSPDQVRQLSNSLQKLARDTSSSIPLLISTDQEGGIVTRIERGFVLFPGNAALGRSQSRSLARDAAYVMGLELGAVGINMNLAPVVDINSNPRNPVIGVRSLNASPQWVALLGVAMLEGYAQAGVITTLKHFPGHGDVTVDSHVGLPCITKSRAELDACELVPFKRLVKSADCVMTAHISLPAIDPFHCATFSHKVLDILRQDLGFQGVIISDSLVMGGADNGESLEQKALRAFQAGCDVLLFGGKLLIEGNLHEALTLEDMTRIHHYLVRAVEEGRVSQERLDDSVARILRLKQVHGLADRVDPSEEMLASQVKTPEHQAIAWEVATRAACVEKGEELLPLDLSTKKVVVYVPTLCQRQAQEALLSKIGHVSDVLLYPAGALDEEKITQLVAVSEKADAMLLFTYNAWKNPEQVVLAKGLAKKGKLLICIALRDAEDSALLQMADVVMTTVSPTVVSIQAAMHKLIQKRQYKEEI